MWVELLAVLAAYPNDPLSSTRTYRRFRHPDKLFSMCACGMQILRSCSQIILFGNPVSNGTTDSRYLICSGVKDISSASRLAMRCSTFRPPMIGKTKGVFCMTYAIATSITGLMLLRGDGCGYEGHTCSDGLRPNFLCHLLERRARFLLVIITQPVPAKYNAPLSPVSSRFCSSASVLTFRRRRHSMGQAPYPRSVPSELFRVRKSARSCSKHLGRLQTASKR